MEWSSEGLIPHCGGLGWTDGGGAKQKKRCVNSHCYKDLKHDQREESIIYFLLSLSSPLVWYTAPASSPWQLGENTAPGVETCYFSLRFLLVGEFLTQISLSLSRFLKSSQLPSSIAGHFSCYFFQYHFGNRGFKFCIKWKETWQCLSSHKSLFLSWTL